jgi:solute carrier family 50 protein (sugar transporter)
VLGLLFGLAQMALHLVYKNPKKNGAVSEVLPADAEKAQVQLQQQQKEEAAPVVVAATVDADGEVVQGRDDHDDMRQSVAVVDITLPPPEEHPVMPQLEQPAPLPPMRMAVEVV